MLKNGQIPKSVNLIKTSINEMKNIHFAKVYLALKLVFSVALHFKPVFSGI
jgi:hypothetical protein